MTKKKQEYRKKQTFTLSWKINKRGVAGPSKLGEVEKKPEKLTSGGKFVWHR